MSTRGPSTVQVNDRQKAQNGSSSPITTNSNSIYTMRSDLRRCENNLKREKRIEVNHLKSELSDFEGTKQDIYYITNHYIHPDALKTRLRLRDDTFISYDDVLELMLKDALHAHSLRREVQSLRSSTQTAQTEVQTLQNRLAELEASQDQAQSMQDRALSLQEQVHSLQKQLLNDVDKVRVVPDDIFEHDFRSLIVMVKLLSRSVRVTEDTNVLDVVDNRGLHLNVHDHHWNTRARKMHFTEAWIWSVLLEMVFKTPFTILGDNGTVAVDLWCKLFGSKHHHGWPNSSALCESWRCTTMKHAIEVMGQATSAEGAVKVEYEASDEAAPQEFESEELRIRNIVANEIGTRLANLSTLLNFPLVPKIVEAAYALALQMNLQRSRLQITFPSVDEQFDRVQMMPIPNADGEDLEDGIVAFIVRPGLTKWGDAHGRHFDQRYDIAPSLVQLQVQREGVVIKSELI